MIKKCVYCSLELKEESVADVCIRCGHGVWGEQMFETIINNMKRAKDEGNLHQGSITDSIGSGSGKAF